MSNVGFHRHAVATVVVSVLLLCTNAAPAQSRKPHPDDGKSAIEIAVTAELQRLKAGIPTKRATARPVTKGGSSSATLLDVQLVELKGRPLHQGEFSIPGDPLVGSVMALATLYGANSAQFRLVDLADMPIQDITLLPSDVQYNGSFVAPNEPFKIAVSGQDTDNVAFDFIFDQVFTPQIVEVRFEFDIQTVSPGSIDFNVDITNFGSADTFNIVADNDMGFPISTDLSSIPLSQDGSGQIVVTLDLPTLSVGVLNTTLTVTATGVTDPTSTNHGISVAVLERFGLLFRQGFEQ